MSRPIAWRAPLLYALLLLGACSRTGITCSGCPGVSAARPIPGGFDPDQRIDRAVQVRFTETGAGFIESSFRDLVGAYAAMRCGPGGVPCPDHAQNEAMGGFVDLATGGPLDTTCSPSRAVCVNAQTSQPEPVVAFPIPRTAQSSAIICRDLPSDPNPPRDCNVWLRLESLSLFPRAPNYLDATISTQIFSTDIPLRYEPSESDCLLTINSANGQSQTQEFNLTAELRPWVSPSGSGGGQLEITIIDLQADIERSDLDVRPDPVHRDGLESGCFLADVFQPLVLRALTQELTKIIDAEVRKVLGWRCNVAGGRACPGGTSCVDTYCVDGDGLVIPQEIGFEGRLDVLSLIPGGMLPGGFAAETDLSFLVGGEPSADAEGINLGLLAGLEPSERDLTCAADLPSPRDRPGFVPPPPLPADDKVDLNFDGTKETSYMLAAGLSDSLIDQASWTLYSSGLMCAQISSYEFDLINTGSLSVLMPSLRELTQNDRFAWSIWPASVRLRPGAEPKIRIGSGRITGTPADPVLAEPLLTLELNDLELTFGALIEDRWVDLMTLSADVAVPVGLTVLPSNQLEIVLGDLANAITDVRARSSGILAESEQDLVDAIPSLLGVVLPQLAGSLTVPFQLPSAAELGGFELDVLGVRGVEVGGAHRYVGVYGNLAFDPSQVQALRAAAETRARLHAVELPESAAMSVAAPGAPARPRVVLGLETAAPAGRAAEHQVRIDGGAWGPFVAGDRIVLERPELLVQGKHRVEVRGRWSDDYRSLDPTPVELEVVIDTEAPLFDARLVAPAGGAELFAHDVVFGEEVALELEVGGERRAVSPDRDGFVAIPEVEDPAIRIVARAKDALGNTAERVLRRGDPIPASGPAAVLGPSGCRASGPAASGGPGALLVLAALLVLRRRR